MNFLLEMDNEGADDKNDYFQSYISPIVVIMPDLKINMLELR